MERYLQKKVSAAPLATFRILFGLLMIYSSVRFWSNGWIEKFYIEPELYFHYYGFEWVQSPGEWTYLLFALMIVTSIFILLGFRYYWSMAVFFLSFTYVELIDKTCYLNHYYFVSALSFLLLFLPMSTYFSLDAVRDRKTAHAYVPAWTVDSIKVLITIVYLYAGLAKLNSYWLMEAMPLKIWLPLKQDIPIIGHMLSYRWSPYLFSWGGAIYDSVIPFMLWNRKTRGVGFAFVVIFHVLTGILFPIGVFPLVMIASSTIFFAPSMHQKVIDSLRSFLNMSSSRAIHSSWQPTLPYWKIIIPLFLIFQIAFPMRHLAYPGELFWKEEGFRFSWRVMLMEKTGIATFKIKNGETGQYFLVDNTDFLDARQEKQMSTQADFILEYAHFLKDKFEKDGHENIEIYVDNFVSLNGRPSQRMVDPNQDLTKLSDSFRPKSWIRPFKK